MKALVVLILAAATSTAALAQPSGIDQMMRRQPQVGGAETDITKARQVQIAGQELGALQGALGSIERRDRVVKEGAVEKQISETVPVCLTDSEKKCIPREVSLVIAKNLRALQNTLNDFQKMLRSVQGEESGDTGYVEPGSPAEARARYKISQLNSQPFTVVYWAVDLKALEDRQVNVPSSTRAILSAAQLEVLE